MILESGKLIHDQLIFSSNLLSNPNGGFLTLEVQKTWIMTINVTKLKKMAKIAKKYAEICDVKFLREILFKPEIIQSIILKP